MFGHVATDTATDSDEAPYDGLELRTHGVDVDVELIDENCPLTDEYDTTVTLAGRGVDPSGNTNVAPVEMVSVLDAVN